jgi:hypothetical protein
LVDDQLDPKFTRSKVYSIEVKIGNHDVPS